MHSCEITSRGSITENTKKGESEASEAFRDDQPRANIIKFATTVRYLSHIFDLYTTKYLHGELKVTL